MQFPKGLDQVSGGVSVPCLHATPVANVLWIPLKIGKMSSSVQSLIIIWGIIHVICNNVIVNNYGISFKSVRYLYISGVRNLAPKSWGGGQKERKKKLY